MAKSQITGHVFIYILTAALVSIIFIYGYNTVLQLREKAEQLSFLRFHKEISESIKSIYFEKGSVNIKIFDVPPKYDEVCFLNTFDASTEMQNIDTDPIMIDTINSKLQKNIFLRTKKITKEFNHIEEKISAYAIDTNLKKTIDILCILSINGKIKLRLEGMGDHVKIEQSN